MRIGIRTLLPHQFYLRNVQSYIFYKLQVMKHFLTSLILFEGSTLINLDFFTKEDFWYVYITFIRVKKFSFIYKSCKVDAITSILREKT